MTPPMTGDMTQLAAMPAITPQSTDHRPAAAIPAPMTPPTTECVVDTGAPIAVARLIQTAEASSAAVMAPMNIAGSPTA